MGAMHQHDAISSDTVLAHGPVQWAVAGTEIVLHVPALGATAVLDPTSALLWQCIDGVSPLGDLFADLADAFAVPEARVATDCLPAVESWLASGAVVRVPAGAGGHATVGDSQVVQAHQRHLVHPPDT